MKHSYWLPLVFAVSCGRLTDDSVSSTRSCSTASVCKTGLDCAGGDCIPESDTDSITARTDYRSDGGEDSDRWHAGSAQGGVPSSFSSAGGNAPSRGGQESGAAGTGGDDDAGLARAGAAAGTSEELGEGGAGGAAGAEDGAATGEGGEGGACDASHVVPVGMTCPEALTEPDRPYAATGLGFLDSLAWEEDRDQYRQPVSDARAMNDRGQVVGHAAFCGSVRAFRFSAGVMTNLGVLPGDDHSMAWSINDAGTVIGMSGNDRTGSRPFVWRDGAMHTLTGVSHLPQPIAVYDINDEDQIALTDGVGVAYVWDGGSLTRLGPDVTPRAMNNVGQVVGTIGRWQEQRAFVWKEGVLTVLSDEVSEAYDVNDSGQVVGRRYDGNIGHATLWDGGEMLEVIPPTDYPLVDSVALGINDFGALVGIYQEAGPRPNSLGYVYSDGVFTRLEGSTPGEFASLNAWAINDRGEVAGTTSHEWGSPDQARVWSTSCFGECCERY